MRRLHASALGACDEVPCEGVRKGEREWMRGRRERRRERKRETFRGVSGSGLSGVPLDFDDVVD